MLDTTTGNIVTEFATEDEMIEFLSAVQAKDEDEPLLEYARFRYEVDRPILVARERDLVFYLARARERGVTGVVRARRRRSRIAFRAGPIAIAARCRARQASHA